MPTDSHLRGAMRDAAVRLESSAKNVRRKHKGDNGEAREKAVIAELLERFLPDRFGVASGEIIASDGSSSPAMDIIIYDAQQTPLFDAATDNVLVPIEGVYGVVEVASHLDRSKLVEDAAKIARVKAMEKVAFYDGSSDIVHTFTMHGRTTGYFPILGFCYGYSGATAETLLAALDELDEAEPHMRVDSLIVADRFVVANADPGGILSGFPQLDTVRCQRPCGDAAERLMVFFLAAFGPIAQAHMRPVRLANYM